MTPSDLFSFLPLTLLGLLGIAFIALIIYVLGSLMGLPVLVIALMARSPSAQVYAHRAKLISIAALTLLLVREGYFAVYPDDDFYLAEARLVVDFHAELTRGFHLKLTHRFMRTV